MAAKEKWLGNDVPAAREVLERAFVANPEGAPVGVQVHREQSPRRAPCR
jgi:hypothetical protein